MALLRNELEVQHQDLAIDVDRLHLLLQAPEHALPEPRVRRLLARELTDLAAVLERHFAYEEDGGYLAHLIGEAPEVGDRVARLQAQHGAILEGLARLSQDAANADLGPVRAAIGDVLDALETHEAQESKLMRSSRA